MSTELLSPKPPVESEPEPQPEQSFGSLLQLAITEKSAIDVIERLAALQERAVLRQAEFDLNQAMTQCQQELKMVINDAEGQKKKYATYRALDKEVRPIYLKHGFSLSFGSKECSIPDHIVVTCLLSKGMYTRPYELLMDASGKGPKGDGALSRPHAILAAMEYGRRCLLKSIFNLVTGDEEDNSGEGEVDKDWLTEQLTEIGRCETLEGLDEAFRKAGRVALNEQDIEAYRALNKAKNVQKKKLKEAA